MKLTQKECSYLNALLSLDLMALGFTYKDLGVFREILGKVDKELIKIRENTK